MALIDKVHDLFLLEQQVRGLTTRLDAATRRHKAQQTRLDQLIQQQAEMSNQLKHARAKASDLEKQSNDMEARITRQREAMNSVKTNKEFAALNIEVNTLRVEKSKFEDQALEQMGQVEQFDKELKILDQKVADQRKLVSGAETEVAESRAEISDQLDALTKQRDAAEQELSPTIRQTFRRIAHIQDGEVMAAVVEENRRSKEYSCGGCFMGIPIERVNAIMVNANDLVTCPTCGRILYLDEKFRASYANK